MNTRFVFKSFRLALGLVLLFGLMMSDVRPASAALRCYVKADVIGGDGTSWLTAYNSLQSALGVSSCTEVWVAAGTYRPTGGVDRTVSFVLKSGVTIYGGFAGSETLLTQRNPIANPTILSGDIGTSGNSDNSYHVVVGSGTDNTALLDGFTITSGNADGSSWPNYVGGGLHNYVGDPNLANLILTNNSATTGGGMYNDSNPNLTNVAFSNNSANSGGGMFNLFGSPALTNVTFSSNTADQGGGVYNYESSPSLTNVTFSGNSTTYSGGGLYNYQSSPILVNVTFSGNSAPYGGGIFNGNSNNPIITNAILYGDTGGEIYNESSSPTVSFSIVQGGYSGIANLNADPLLGPLQDNGGFTYTMALGTGSPAIEAGNDEVCPPTDQRGVPRPQDPHCDIGAFEFDQFVPPEVLSVQRVDSDPTEATSVDFTVTFSEPVTGVDTASPFGDFDLTTSGVSGASVLAVSGSGAVYLVTVNTGSRSGTIRLDVVDDDTIRNASTGTRPLGGEGIGNGNYTAGETYTVKKSATVQCYVKADAVGNNDGSSWTDAYTSLQSPLGDSPCTEIWVAKGTYKPTISTDRTISFTLLSGVSLYGGFAGTETLLTERDPVANPTILSGDIGTTGNSDNSYHVVVGIGMDSSALLDGFTITGGNANNTSGWNSNGGGMVNWNNSSPSLMNVIFSENSATDGGGMLNYDGSSPSLTNVTFNGNSAPSKGGGMLNYNGSSPSLTNVTFSGNVATNGGGMYNFGGSSPSLTNVTFSSNEATSKGGGLYNETESGPTLTNVTFSNNLADRGGGVFNFNRGSPTLVNVTFSGNSAMYGGGMFNDTSIPVLTNVTLSGNSATAGGGMYNLESAPSLTNVTINSNYGGGIFSQGGSNLTITNSILYGNTGGELTNDSSDATVSYSIVQGGYAGTGNLNANPLLGPLQDNGGFTKTMMPGFGSPAIDKGANSGCPPEDQRGMARPQDGDGNGIAICDMGATEAPRLFTSAFQSAGSQDGWVLESTETSGVGGTMNSRQATFAVGDDAADRQGRSILSFNTSDLPDDAEIASVVLKIKKAGVVGTNPFKTHGKLVVDLRRGAFSKNAALQLRDFQAVAHKNGAMVIKNKPVDGWYSGPMTSTYFTYINKRGVTQFRLRFAKDDNDDMSLDYIKFYSGNCLTTAYWPQLIIQYYMP